MGKVKIQKMCRWDAPREFAGVWLNTSVQQKDGRMIDAIQDKDIVVVCSGV